MCLLRKSKFVSGLVITTAGTVGFIALNIIQNNQKFYSELFMPTLQTILSPECSHKFAIKLAKYGLVPNFKKSLTNYNNLSIEVCNLKFDHPIGLAAGFDKDGEAVLGLSKLSFSFIEIGTVTPLPQYGHQKPRVFRLEEDKAIINRYGFNSLGHEVVRKNLSRTLSSKKPVIVGVNLGKNKSTQDSVSDYLKGLEAFSNCSFVDYFVINISSPNTPGLQNIQKRNELDQFLERLLNEKSRLNVEKPLLLKISPDLSQEEKKDIAELILKPRKSNCKVDGLIINNTTTSRDFNLKSSKSNETGGLSGLPLKQISNQTIREFYNLTKGKVPIIGVGGVTDASDAYQKLKAGASLVQVYTALTYSGPSLITTMIADLSKMIREDGFNNVQDIIGIESKQKNH